MNTPTFNHGPLAAVATLIFAVGATQAQELPLTENQINTYDGIRQLCAEELAPNRDQLEGASERLLDRCGEIVRLETDNIGPVPNALQRVQTEEIEILGAQATEGAGNQLENIGNRLQAVRAGATGVSLGLAEWEGQGIPVGGMASSDEFARWGLFATLDYATGDRDDSNNVDGFDFDTWGVTIGADYRFGESFVVGAAYHYLDSEADIDNNYGELDTEGNSFTLYATHFGENYYLEATIGAGEYEYDSERNVDYHTDATFHEIVTASPDGDQVSWSLGGGYLRQSGRLGQSYYVQVAGIDLDIDDYTEKTNNPDNGAMAMTVDDQEIESLTSELGAQFSYPISQDFGVVVPYLDISWIHEFEDGGDPILARYANADNLESIGVTNVDFSVLTDEFDEDYFRLSLGTNVALSGGLQVFLNYDTFLGLDDYTYHGISAGLRKEL